MGFSDSAVHSRRVCESNDRDGTRKQDMPGGVDRLGDS